jgi:hypothetical protein
MPASNLPRPRIARAFLCPHSFHSHCRQHIRTKQEFWHVFWAMLRPLWKCFGGRRYGETSSKALLSLKKRTHPPKHAFLLKQLRSTFSRPPCDFRSSLASLLDYVEATLDLLWLTGVAEWPKSAFSLSRTIRKKWTVVSVFCDFFDSMNFLQRRCQEAA